VCCRVSVLKSVWYGAHTSSENPCKRVRGRQTEKLRGKKRVQKRKRVRETIILLYVWINVRIFMHISAWCSVLPTAPAPCAVSRRSRHTPSCLSLSTPARPYLDDSGMPLLGCNVEAAAAGLIDAHDQRHAALLAQHLHPCSPARVMCVRVCACVSQ